MGRGRERQRSRYNPAALDQRHCVTAVINEQEFTIAGLFSVGVWDWQPLADSSIVVVGSVSRTLTGNSQAWIGRYKLVPRLPTSAAAAQPTTADLQLYPNPAGAGSPTRAGLPLGTGPGQLRVRDALGRLVYQQSVGAGRADVALPTAGLAPGCYRVEFVPDRAEQRRVAATLLVE